VAGHETISHPLFVDDVLCFTQGSMIDLNSLKEVLDIYCKDTSMEINVDKSCLITHCLSNISSQQIYNLLPFPKKELEIGFKYLGFFLKPGNYRYANWLWLVKKVEMQVSFWVNKLLSRGGRLVLLKSVLEIIIVYWTLIIVVPKGIFSKTKKLIPLYLWLGSHGTSGIPLVNWKQVATPKRLRRWGMPNLFLLEFCGYLLIIPPYGEGL
jgi:hypothetical protein